MNNEILNFIQDNSPDGGFLQSEYWRKFQEAVGRKIYGLSETDENGELIAHANIITHRLPVAGDYFYVPRGPVVKISNFQFSIFKPLEKFLNDLFDLAQKNNIGWIRIEPNSEEELNLIRESLPGGIIMKKSAVDVQPREILILDIAKSEEELLARMKQKTRYNIRLAEKRGVRVSPVNSDQRSVMKKFLELVKITSKRDKITAHPENYYRKMFETIPSEILKLYIAEYQGKTIVANLVLFFGKTATYLHGASDNIHRDVMAPHLLQWQAIKDAKISGYMKYDLGGVKTEKISNFKFKISNSWSGITKFKTGFAPETKSVQFPGCYDIVLNPVKYNLYRILQRIKRII